MRKLFLAAAASLATAATAGAQPIVIDPTVPGPSGAVVIRAPFYNGLAFSNGAITAFPVAPRYGYGNPYPVAIPYPAGNPYPIYPALRPNIPRPLQVEFLHAMATVSATFSSFASGRRRRKRNFATPSMRVSAAR